MADETIDNKTKRCRKRFTKKEEEATKEMLANLVNDGFSVASICLLTGKRADLVKRLLFDLWAEKQKPIPHAKKHLISKSRAIGQIPGFENYEIFEATTMPDGSKDIHPVEMDCLRASFGIKI